MKKKRIDGWIRRWVGSCSEIREAAIIVRRYKRLDAETGDDEVRCDEVLLLLEQAGEAMNKAGLAHFHRSRIKSPVDNEGEGWKG